MESKQVFRIDTIYEFKPFNRTSMESKLSGLSSYRVARDRLLIEPVWNRNFDFARGPRLKLRAFNRTSMESKLHEKPRETRLAATLLIEPVWNRNGVAAS